jgi:uncharacterized protein YkwD
MHRHLIALLLTLLTLVGCGGEGLGTRGSSSPSSSSSSPSAKGAGDEGKAEERVVYEKMPDGSIKKTTIRTTKRVVPAPDPPPRPEDPYPSDPLVRYNVEQINKYRKQKGLGRVLYDAKISAFATKGSERLSKDHDAHAHFAANAKGAPGFGSRSAENQGDPSGVPSLDPDPVKNGKKQIDIMLKLMMDEGPGGGHHDNMMNPRFRRVGIGLVYSGGRLYMTNDFSN